MADLKSGMQCVIFGHKRPDNNGKVVRLDRLLMPGEELDAGRFGKMWMANAEPSWLVFGDDLLVSANGILQTLDFCLCYPRHLFPIDGDVTDTQDQETLVLEGQAS